MKTVLSYLDDINSKINRVKKLYNGEFDIVYRGESKLFETPLQPTFLRDFDLGMEDFLLELITDYDISDKDTSLKRIIDSQHFISLSRVLDVTYNVLVSLYFACSETQFNDDDSYVYLIFFPYTVSPSNIMFRGNFQNIYDFTLIGASFNNERVRAQAGGFIFYPTSEQSPLPESLVEFVKINSEDKKRIVEELHDYFNIAEHTLFPEKDKRKGTIVKKLSLAKTHGNQNLNSNPLLLNHSNFFNRVCFELSVEMYKLVKDYGPDDRVQGEIDILRKLRLRKEVSKKHVKKDLQRIFSQKENKEISIEEYNQLEEILNEQELLYDNLSEDFFPIDESIFAHDDLYIESSVNLLQRFIKHYSKIRNLSTTNDIVRDSNYDSFINDVVSLYEEKMEDKYGRLTYD